MVRQLGQDAGKRTSPLPAAGSFTSSAAGPSTNSSLEGAELEGVRQRGRAALPDLLGHLTCWGCGLA